MKNAFVVSPMSQKIVLKPGETYTGEIRVSNPAAATEDFHYKTELYPFFIKGDDYEKDFETVSDWSRIVEWTTLENETGVLKPNEAKKIVFTIKVPHTAPGGGQYMMIGVSSDFSTDAAGGFAIQNVYEMASLVYAEIEGEVNHAGRVVENEIPSFITTDSPYVSTKINNTGNVHETAEITITVKNSITGETILPREDKKNTFESVIMPESTRTIKQEIGDLPPLGIFEISESVSYMGAEMSTTSLVLLCPIWFIVLVLFTIISIIELIFYRKRSRRKKLEKSVDLSKN